MSDKEIASPSGIHWKFAVDNLKNECVGNAFVTSLSAVVPYGETEFITLDLLLKTALFE